MNNVNTSSQTIRAAIDICVKAIDVLRTENMKIKGDYTVARANWNDAKYQQLNDIVIECCSSFEKAIRDLNDCLVPLSNMIKYVSEYEEININGGMTSASGEIADNFGSHTPFNNGSWSGERGNSTWLPTNKSLLNDLMLYGNGADGISYRNGFPDFSPVQVYECKLNSRLYLRNDGDQFVDCTLELRSLLEEHAKAKPPNRDLLQWFDDSAIEAIGRGQPKIPGYTWHHDVQTGRIQLIPTSIHRACSHDGGRSIWGGGTFAR